MSNADPHASAPLAGKVRRELRARAHALKPVVWVAQPDASTAVLREVDRALDAHELIKIHAAIDGKDERTALLDAICSAVSAHPVQVIGKMLIAYRKRAEPTAAQSAPSRPATARSRRVAGRPRSAQNKRPKTSRRVRG